MATFYKADALEQLKKFESKSVDLIYFDPPFATTGCWWDDALDWPAIFVECFRVLRPTGNLVIHCSIPFSYTLIRAAPRAPSYSWFWKKNRTTNFLNINKQPMRQVEEILVWKMPKAKYFQQRLGTQRRWVSSGGGESSYFAGSQPKLVQREVEGWSRTHLLEFPVQLDGWSTRPAELVELMIRSYTQENDTVLDLTCYKGLSGVVCKRLNRKWIGVDKYHYPLKLF